MYRQRSIVSFCYEMQVCVLPWNNAMSETKCNNPLVCVLSKKITLLTSNEVYVIHERKKKCKCKACQNYSNEFLMVLEVKQSQATNQDCNFYQEMSCYFLKCIIHIHKSNVKQIIHFYKDENFATPVLFHFICVISILFSEYK